MFKNNKAFSKEILNKLNEVSVKLVNVVLKDVFDKIQMHADDPTIWPLKIGEEIKSIVDCERALNFMVEKLDKNGFTCICGTDYYAIDITPELDDLGQDKEEIIKASTAFDFSRNSEKIKMLEVFDYLSQIIENDALKGEHKVVISIMGHPINGNPRVIKRLIKKLIGAGYWVGDAAGKKIDTEARPDYAKIKKLTIGWNK